MTTSLRASAIFFSLITAVAGIAATGCVDDGIESSSTTAEIGTRPYFDLWRNASGQYRFHLVDTDGNILVTSEGYTSRTGALNGVLSVLDNGGLSTRYQIKPSSNGGAYFNLRAANYQVIATSQIYADVAAAQADVDATIAAVAAYVEFWENGTGARYAVHQDVGGKYYFNLHAKNGEIVLHSQRYDTEASALNGAFSVHDNGTTSSRYLVLQAANGGYYLNLTATNGQIIATSEVYASKYNAERARDAIIALIPDVALL